MEQQPQSQQQEPQPDWDLPARQLLYYFSDANFCKDAFLRSLRAEDTRCVPLSELARFPKLARLAQPLAGKLSAGQRAPPGSAEPQPL